MNMFLSFLLLSVLMFYRSSKNVFKISNALSDEDATLIEPLSVAIHVLEQLELKPDASVLVLGAGPSGTFRYLIQP